jgi:lactoylglutathione lyase
MIGTGPELTNFALELTYNYGIDGYKFGNDLQYIALHSPSALTRAQALGYPVDGNTITGPDSYKYKVIVPTKGRAEQFAVIGLRVADLANAKAYWMGVLGLQEFDIPSGLETSDPSAVVGFAGEQTKLQLIQVGDGQPVDHALSR